MWIEKIFASTGRMLAFAKDFFKDLWLKTADGRANCVKDDHNYNEHTADTVESTHQLCLIRHTNKTIPP